MVGRWEGEGRKEGRKERRKFFVSLVAIKTLAQ